MTKANKILEVMRAYSAELQSRNIDTAIKNEDDPLNDFIESLGNNPRVRLFFGTGGLSIFPAIADCVPDQFRESVSAVKNLHDLEKLSYAFESALQRGDHLSGSTEEFWMNTTLHLLWDLGAIVNSNSEIRSCKYCFRRAIKNRSICALHSAKRHSNMWRVAAIRALNRMGGQMPEWMIRAQSVLSLTSDTRCEIHLVDTPDMLPFLFKKNNDILLVVPRMVYRIDMSSNAWSLLTPTNKIQKIKDALEVFSVDELDGVFQIARDTSDWEEFATALKTNFQCEAESSKPVLLLIWLTQALLERSFYKSKKPGRKPMIETKKLALNMIKELGGPHKRGVKTAVCQKLGIARKTLNAWLKP